MTKKVSNSLCTLWNVPNKDPFVGQGAFIVRTGSHDEIYKAYTEAVAFEDGTGRGYLMTDPTGTPLYCH
jgi:hypothetical protein